MSNTITPFERRALEAFCDVKELPIPDLARKISDLRVISRECTGHGIFVNFEAGLDADESVPRVVLGDVSAGREMNSPEVGFILFTRNGEIEMLEGFSYIDDWPDDVSEFAIFPDLA